MRIVSGESARSARGQPLISPPGAALREIPGLPATTRVSARHLAFLQPAGLGKPDYLCPCARGPACLLEVPACPVLAARRRAPPSLRTGSRRRAGAKMVGSPLGALAGSLLGLLPAPLALGGKEEPPLKHVLALAGIDPAVRRSAAGGQGPATRVFLVARQVGSRKETCKNQFREEVNLGRLEIEHLLGERLWLGRTPVFCKALGYPGVDGSGSFIYASLSLETAMHSQLREQELERILVLPIPRPQLLSPFAPHRQACATSCVAGLTVVPGHAAATPAAGGLQRSAPAGGCPSPKTLAARLAPPSRDQGAPAPDAADPDGTSARRGKRAARLAGLAASLSSPSRGKALASPEDQRGQVAAAYARRWGQLLAVAAQGALAASRRKAMSFATPAGSCVTSRAEPEPARRLVCNLRSARRGAAPGPSGAAAEHYRILLDDEESTSLFMRAAQDLARADVSAAILEGLRFGRVVALLVARWSALLAHPAMTVFASPLLCQTAGPSLCNVDGALPLQHPA
ncbi:unnamed protein product [Effrenium voratum]|nr:unnamed protein product [Effrenium voratum]